MRGTASRYRNQEMLQELFTEINEYLGDQRVSDTMDLPLEERLQVQTDKRADDIDQESKIQLTEQSPQSSPLRPDRPILVESCCDSESDFDKTSIATREFEYFSRPLSAASKSQTPRSIQDADTKPTVCMCYKCKKERPLTTMQNQSDKEHGLGYVCVECQDRSRNNKSRSWSTAASGLRVAAIGDLVKHTLSSTPLDIIPPYRDRQTRSNKKRQQKQRMKRPESLPSMYAYADSLYQDETSYEPNAYEKKRTRRLSTKSMIYDHGNESRHTIAQCDSNPVSHQDSSPTEELIPGNQDQPYYDTTVPSFQQDATIEAVDDFDVQEAPLHYGEERTMEDVNMLNRDHSLPFLITADRVGEEHQALSVREVRQMSSREDRMTAYNNAYQHCIFAKTSMIPWLQKQYSKGPPDAMFDYIPRPKKTQKSFFSKLKRCTGSKKQTREPSVTLSDNLSRSMVTLSNHISLKHQLSASVSPGPNEQLSAMQHTPSPAPPVSAAYDPEPIDFYSKEHQNSLLHMPEQTADTHQGESISPRPILKRADSYEDAVIKYEDHDSQEPAMISRVPSAILNQRRRAFEGEDPLPPPELLEKKPSRPRSNRRRRSSSQLYNLKYHEDHLTRAYEEPAYYPTDDNEDDVYFDDPRYRRIHSRSPRYLRNDNGYVEDYSPEAYICPPSSRALYPPEPLIYEKEERRSPSSSRHPRYCHRRSPSGASSRRRTMTDLNDCIVTFKEPMWGYQ